MGRLITYSGVATVSQETIDWADRLNALQHSRCREDSVIADSVSTMAAMNLGDVDAAERRLAAGIAGSEELQLPVLRAQLRWMEAVLAAWWGDFVEAERHHAIAAHVHEQTELYDAGSGLVAAVSLLREKGTPVPSGWPGITAGAETGGQGMVGLLKTALLAVDDGPDARANAVAILDGWVADTGRPHVWTALGHNVLLAHFAADHGRTHYCRPLLAELEPFGDRIAVMAWSASRGPSRWPVRACMRRPRSGTGRPRAGERPRLAQRRSASMRAVRGARGGADRAGGRTSNGGARRRGRRPLARHATGRGRRARHGLTATWRFLGAPGLLGQVPAKRCPQCVSRVTSEGEGTRDDHDRHRRRRRRRRHPYGLAPLCGSAPGVGVIGYLTGGGVGPLVRSVGLSVDHVRAFDLVTGSWEVLHVTPDEHADLFWGARGGKSALGIVTEMEIDLLPIAEFYGGHLVRRRRRHSGAARLA